MKVFLTILNVFIRLFVMTIVDAKSFITEFNSFFKFWKSILAVLIINLDTKKKNVDITDYRDATHM